MASRNYEYLPVALNDTKQRVFKQRAELEREVGHSCINGVFLDELEPDAGRKGDELTGDCGVICYLEFMKIEENNNI